MFIEAFLLLLALNSLSAGRVSRPEGRIINGETIGIEQAPWQVSLLLKGRHQCGGSIYSADIIITAAHCFFDKFGGRHSDQKFQVRAGSALKDSNGNLVEIVAIKIHENYGRPFNDIAIVRLSKPLEFTNRVMPIPLAKTNPYPGTTAFISGWGLFLNANDVKLSYPKHLQGLTVYIQRLEYCGLFAPSIVCAGTFRRATCYGDSGGALVVNKELVGVVGGSLDRNCTSSTYYASVPYFREWILTTVASI
ncbi:trypsin alpha [Drosophila teissieri]|uniref:trypsin alpha n=1 Tax=Drosophila teissieri TaxID=7243 RepID=UPI001CB9D984|nr:trypsin alpha [Drosophila teissieri]